MIVSSVIFPQGNDGFGTGKGSGNFGEILGISRCGWMLLAAGLLPLLKSSGLTSTSRDRANHLGLIPYMGIEWPQKERQRAVNFCYYDLIPM